MTTPDMQAEVSPELIGKTASQRSGAPPRRETGPSPYYWEHCAPK